MVLISNADVPEMSSWRLTSQSSARSACRSEQAGVGQSQNAGSLGPLLGWSRETSTWAPDVELFAVKPKRKPGSCPFREVPEVHHRGSLVRVSGVDCRSAARARMS